MKYKKATVEIVSFSKSFLTSSIQGVRFTSKSGKEYICTTVTTGGTHSDWGVVVDCSLVYNSDGSIFNTGGNALFCPGFSMP